MHSNYVNLRLSISFSKSPSSLHTEYNLGIQNVNSFSSEKRKGYVSGLSVRRLYPDSLQLRNMLRNRLRHRLRHISLTVKVVDK